MEQVKSLNFYWNGSQNRCIHSVPPSSCDKRHRKGTVLQRLRWNRWVAEYKVDFSTTDEDEFYSDDEISKAVSAPMLWKLAAELIGWREWSGGFEDDALTNAVAMPIPCRLGRGSWIVEWC